VDVLALRRFVQGAGVVLEGVVQAALRLADAPQADLGGGVLAAQLGAALPGPLHVQAVQEGGAVEADGFLPVRLGLLLVDRHRFLNRFAETGDVVEDVQLVAVAVEAAGVLGQVVAQPLVDLALGHVKDVGRLFDGEGRPEYVEDLIARDQLMIHEEVEEILWQLPVPVGDGHAVDQGVTAPQGVNLNVRDFRRWRWRGAFFRHELRPQDGGLLLGDQVKPGQVSLLAGVDDDLAVRRHMLDQGFHEALGLFFFRQAVVLIQEQGERLAAQRAEVFGKRRRQVLRPGLGGDSGPQVIAKAIGGGVEILDEVVEELAQVAIGRLQGVIIEAAVWLAQVAGKVGIAVAVARVKDHQRAAAGLFFQRQGAFLDQPFGFARSHFSPDLLALKTERTFLAALAGE